MNKSRRMRWAGHAERMERREMHIVYWLESQKKRRPLGRPKDVEMYVRVIVCGGVDWIDLPQDRNQWRVLLNTVMILRVS
jgi:hypothetical protein